MLKISFNFPSIYYSPNAIFKNRVIKFTPETANKMILQVPLGQLYTVAQTIVVTLGLDKSYLNRADSDLRVAISDGSRQNSFWIVDKLNYGQYSPCYPAEATRDNQMVSTDTDAPSTFKLTFTPYINYGACETAQEGGYINTGTFSTAIDNRSPLFLELYRDGSSEEYYLKVEIFE